MLGQDRENWMKLVKNGYQQLVQDSVLLAADVTNVKAKGK